MFKDFELTLLKKISQDQQLDGSFLTLSSSKDNFLKCKEYKTTFATSLIAYCVSFSKNELAKNITLKACDYLISEISPTGSWNYWSRTSKEFTRKPYPDDLDDTFAALLALLHCNDSIIDGELYAKIVKILTYTEQNIGGPYKTWICESNSGAQWQDIDIVVNSSILFFLSKIHVTLPLLEKYINTKISKYELQSPYYCTIWSTLFFVSRSQMFKDNKNKKAFNSIIKIINKDANVRSPLDTIFIICILCNLGEHKKARELYKSLPSVESLIRPYKIWVDPSINGKGYYAGSASLTASFLLLAYNLLQEFELRKTSDTYILLLKDKVQQHTLNLWSSLSLAKINPLHSINNNGQNSYLAPYIFWKSLKKPFRESIPLSTVNDLCFASAYGWDAYSIYDSIFDGKKHTELIPFANVSMRQAFDIHLQNTHSDEWRKYINNIYFLLDHALIKEKEIYSLKAYTESGIIPLYATKKLLAEKSFGHAISPLLVLATVGFSPQSDEVKNLHSFFYHYLIARQLNDDAHDWKDDLYNGIITPVVARILSSYQRNISFKNLNEHIVKLQEIFWHKTIDYISLDIIEHIKEANIALNKFTFIETTSGFLDLLDPLVNVTKQIQTEKALIIKFISIFNSTQQSP